MTIKSIWLRKIHKWVGLFVGLQFVLWALSGAAMALLDMEAVSGGKAAAAPASRPSFTATDWPAISARIPADKVTSLQTRTLLDRQVIEIGSGDTIKLFDARSGAPVIVDERLGGAIARAAHPEALQPASITRQETGSLAVRNHEPPFWKVDFDDDAASSYYVSAVTGEVLERRTDAWRWWDFFWMLHNMDYVNRTDFNHPLIITAGIAMGWLAVTGFWLLFRTMWRHDFAWLRRRRRA